MKQDDFEALAAQWRDDYRSMREIKDARIAQLETASADRDRYEAALNAIRIVGTLHDAQQIADNALTAFDGEVNGN